MRYIAYIEGIDTPVILHSDDYLIKHRIVGGKFRADGSVALHAASPKGEDVVIIIPSDGKWMFQSLDGAMDARMNEIAANINCYDIVTHGCDDRRD